MADDAAVQESLRRVVASAVFANSPRMSRFLRFVVEETVAGRAGDLKEYVLGGNVFDKPPSFDPAVDPTVRVEASKLRAKLARYYETEGRSDPLIIEIPKGHYAAKFVTRATSTFVEPSAEVPAARTAVVPASARYWTALLVAAVAIVVAAGYAALVLTRARPAPITGRIMLAVLPFQNLTGDSEQEFLCDGLTEELIAHLGAVNPERLGIIARTSAMQYKKTTRRADEIGRELGARYLLETSLRRTGNRIRITAQLIDAQTQSQLWVEQYERDARNLLTLESEMAAAVTQRTVSSFGLTRGKAESSTERQASNSLAYEQYLRGRYHLLSATGEGLRKAQEHFRAAIEQDPSYARAYSGLADTYALLGSYHIMPISESHPLGRQAALKALELDDSLPEAHRSMAGILADHYWQWAEANEHYTRAIELGPNDAITLRLYSFYLAYTGRATEALPLAEQARRLDPVSPSARINLGTVLYLARHFDDAVREFQEALDLNPNSALARALLGLVYVSKGMPDRALAELQAARALSTRPDVIAFHGYTYARAGRKSAALKDIDDLRQLSDDPQGPSPFLVALVYTGLEDNDRAFEWLGKAIDARAWEIPTLKTSPVFDRLRSDPRFPALLDRVGLPQ
jgi:TolB-like protein/Flp pilus assembly protein TadD